MDAEKKEKESNKVFSEEGVAFSAQAIVNQGLDDIRVNVADFLSGLEGQTNEENHPLLQKVMARVDKVIKEMGRVKV